VAKIEQITLHRRTLALQRPFVTAIRTALEIDALIVQIKDTDGRSGWGEAPMSWRTTGESPASSEAAITGPLWSALRGADVDDVRETTTVLHDAVVQNSAARMALDCALYDLAAQSQGIPLFQYLGASTSRVRTDVTLSASVTRKESMATLETAKGFVSDGMKTLKLKVGAGGDDFKTVSELRETIGLDISLRLDANQGWTPEQAVRIINSCEDADINLEFVEQPVRRDDIEGLAFVSERVSTPIMADESVWTRRELREAMQSRAVSMVNVKLAKTGGLSEALDLVALARANNIAVIVGCMAETHVGISSAAALASFVDHFDHHSSLVHDLDGGLLLAHSPVEGGVRYSADEVVLSELPGLGISELVDD
jgi:L-alanine-DL-glutamate epimerase-like enolase superfamily enzyme